ncbi:MAG: tetratricopeptide repeat protein [bacterium]|nr:tetratricopeptide repeat protein [bacterium]
MKRISPFKLKNARIMLIAAAAVLIIKPGTVYSKLSDQKKTAIEKTYSAAQKIENQAKDYNQAITAYNNLVKNNKDSHYGGEALFRIAVIYDERLYEPKKATFFYQRYINEFNGRHSRRAEVRIKALEKYKDADPKVYQQYIGILNSYSENEKEKYLPIMEKFIQDNPSIPFPDDALLWLANEYRGFRRIIENEQHLKKAMTIYEKIINEYPGTRSRLVAMKNLGDCYTLKRDFQKARKLYRQVYKEGGKEGALLIGQYYVMAERHISRDYIFYGICVIIVLFGAGLVKILPIKSFTMQGFRKGLIHSLFFLPVMIILIAVTALLTDPGKDNITGYEPYLLITVFASSLLAIILNGFVLEAEKRAPVNLKFYSVLLGWILIGINYLMFYFLDLLHYVENIIL